MSALKSPLSYGCKTDAGCKRELNEDSVGAYPDLALWFVADGMGGHGGGDVASQTVASRLPDAIRQGSDMVGAILESHAEVEKAAREGRGAEHMGSTVVALKSDDAGYDVAWVGDSRAYLWRNGELRQISRDHSLVQEYLDARNLGPDDVDLSEFSNVITQCLGPANQGLPRVDTVNGSWQAGDKLLLCSDGLYGEVDADAMAEVLDQANNLDDQQIVDRLIERARDNGGSDNISAIVISAPPAQALHRAKRPVNAALAAVLTVLAGILLLYFLGGW